MLIDSHAHLDMEEFEKDLDEVLARALKGGVDRVITIGTDLESSRRALELAEKRPFVHPTVGCHPHNASRMEPAELRALTELASRPRIVAWGEMGLDFFRGYSPPEKQVIAFEQQLDIAVEVGLPVIIHIRDAHEEALRILRGKGKKEDRGVIHCFSGDYRLAMEFIELGYCISIPGTVTYKNAHHVREVASRIPEQFLLLETDAPFLTPVPHRGKRNEPLYVIHTAQTIAEIRGMELQELGAKTSENTVRLFRLPPGTLRTSDGE